MSIIQKLHHPEKYLWVLLKWSILGVAVGTLGGLLGTLFSYMLSLANATRLAHPWLLFFLPLGGLATVGLYKLFRLSHNRGTNEIIESLLHNKPVNPLIAPVIFIATGLTHFLGGSAGREGAALQLGGAGASALAKLLRLKEEQRSVLIMSGMSAVFAGLFGTPLTATLFTMEFVSVGTIFSPALLPCYLSALTASKVALALGVHPETATIGSLSFDWLTGTQVFVLSICVGFLGIAMCILFHEAQKSADKRIANPFLRIALGAGLIIVLTLLVGDSRYSGAGMEMALHAVAGQADWYDFALKLLFTAITLAAGFKGGEIVPTFCIGATFGCVLGDLLGLDPGIAAALGLVSLFCAVTNSPLTAIVLSIEMFGSENLHVFAFACVIVFVISGNWGLYSSQIIQFSKARFMRKDSAPVASAESIPAQDKQA